MSTLWYSGGAYLNASGTRDAFGRASDHLVSEGHPAIGVVSGDREYADQVAVFLLRYVQAGDIRGRHVYDIRYWNGVAWYRISAAGTVAVPGTSNHESRRAADLAYPYNNRYTAAHQRLQQIAWMYGIKWTGVNFAEDWHWENVGALGAIGRPASIEIEDVMNATQEAKLDRAVQAAEEALQVARTALAEVKGIRGQIGGSQGRKTTMRQDIDWLKGASGGTNTGDSIRAVLRRIDGQIRSEIAEPAEGALVSDSTQDD